MRELDDGLLERAFGEARERMLARLPEEETLDHVFSDDFEEKMRRMLAAEKRSPWQRRMTVFARRAAVIMLAAAVGFSACIMSVDAWKQGLFRMVEEKFPEYSNITYEPVEGAAGVAEFTLAEYQPAYLPDGFRLTEQMIGSSINWSTYTNAEGDMISFQQTILGSGSMSINTEGSQLEEFDLNGETAFKMDNRGSQFVLWNDNQYQYMVLTNDRALDEAVKIAASIKLYPASAAHPPHLEMDQGQLPDPYSPEEAVRNGDVVIQDGEIQNLETLEKLFSAQQTSPARWRQEIIRVTDFDQGTPIIRDLYFDGFRVHCEEDNTRSPGQEKNSYSGYTYAKLVRETADGVTTVYGIDDYTGDRMELMRYRNLYSDMVTMRTEKDTYSVDVDKIRTILTNNSKQDMIYGTEFHIERQKNGDWVAVEGIGGRWNDVAMGLYAGESVEHTSVLGSLHEPLTPGRYRIVKPVGPDRAGSWAEDFDISAEFTVE